MPRVLLMTPQAIARRERYAARRDAKRAVCRVISPATTIEYIQCDYCGKNYEDPDICRVRQCFDDNDKRMDDCYNCCRSCCLDKVYKYR